MFVTGPDVVKTVTNETVTPEELGGASVHTVKSSIADGAFDNDLETLLEIRRLFDFLPLSNQSPLPEIETSDPVGPAGAVARHADPGRRQQALRHQGADPEDARRGRVLRDPGGACEEHRHRLRPHRRAHGRRGRQPADGAGRRARLRRLAQGGALRALLRLLFDPARHLRRRARASCPAPRRNMAG